MLFLFSSKTSLKFTSKSRLWRYFSSSIHDSKNPNEDPYEVLNLTRLASYQEVKDAFRKLAQQYHPDVHLQFAKSDKEKDLINERFLRIKTAYDQIIYEITNHNPAENAHAQHSPHGEAPSKSELERSLHMDRIRNKIYADLERRKFEQFLKEQDDEKRKREMDKARDEYRKAEVDKHVNFMKAIQSARIEKRQNQTAELLRRRKKVLDTPSTSQQWQDYDEQKARSAFDDEALRGLNSVPEHSKISREEIEAQRALEIEKMRLEKQKQAEIQKQKFIEQVSISQSEFIKQTILKQQQPQSPMYQPVSFGGSGESSGSFIAILGVLSIAGLLALKLIGQNGIKEESQTNLSRSLSTLRKSSNQGQSKEIQEPSDSTKQEEHSQNQKEQIKQIPQEEYYFDDGYNDEDFRINSQLNLNTFRTEVIIPFEVPSCDDPEWLWKKHAGKKLTQKEYEEYLDWKYVLELNKLQREELHAPNKAVLINIMDAYYIKQKECLISHSCAGKNYSVFDGIFDKCGKMDPFVVWNKFVNEVKCQRSIDYFMAFYDIPAFHCPTDAASRHINAFFQAKYGMFYCYDNNKLYGLIDFDADIITRWERNPKQLKRTWNLAVISAMNDRQITFKDIERYRIADYKNNPAFRKFVRKGGNPL